MQEYSVKNTAYKIRYNDIDGEKNAGHSMAWENPKGLALAISNSVKKVE